MFSRSLRVGTDGIDHDIDTMVRMMRNQFELMFAREGDTDSEHGLSIGSLDDEEEDQASLKVYLDGKALYCGSRIRLGSDLDSISTHSSMPSLKDFERPDGEDEDDASFSSMPPLIRRDELYSSDDSSSVGDNDMPPPLMMRRPNDSSDGDNSTDWVPNLQPRRGSSRQQLEPGADSDDIDDSALSFLNGDDSSDDSSRMPHLLDADGNRVGDSDDDSSRMPPLIDADGNRVGDSDDDSSRMPPLIDAGGNRVGNSDDDSSRMPPLIDADGNRVGDSDDDSSRIPPLIDAIDIQVVDDVPSDDSRPPRFMSRDTSTTDSSLPRLVSRNRYNNGGGVPPDWRGRNILVSERLEDIPPSVMHNFWRSFSRQGSAGNDSDEDDSSYQPSDLSLGSRSSNNSQGHPARRGPPHPYLVDDSTLQAATQLFVDALMGSGVPETPDNDGDDSSLEAVYE